MPWGEAIRLTQVLANDLSSRTCASMQGWSHPMSAEAIVLADLFDLWTDKKSAPYPRPWNQPKRTALGTPVTLAAYHELWG